MIGRGGNTCAAADCPMNKQKSVTFKNLNLAIFSSLCFIVSLLLLLLCIASQAQTKLNNHHQAPCGMWKVVDILWLCSAQGPKGPSTVGCRVLGWLARKAGRGRDLVLWYSTKFYWPITCNTGHRTRTYLIHHMLNSHHVQVQDATRPAWSLVYH